MASPTRTRSSTRAIAGSKPISTARSGPAATSAWPIAPPRRHCSTPTGCTRSEPTVRSCAPIAGACWRGHRSRARSRKHGPSAHCFRRVRRMGIERPGFSDLADPATTRIMSPATAAAHVQHRDIAMPHYTAIVTLLAIALYFFLATRVAVARVTFKVKHPATTGNPDFERIFRAHVNTLEWMPTFLVPLWICAFYFSDRAAAAVGLLWVTGRIVYFFGYRGSVPGRLPGFFIQVVAALLLMIGAIAGIVMHS